MVFRFRRSIKIAPGVRLNVGKKGGSVSIGPRGAKLTTGTSGTRVTGGIPGTGLSVTEKIGSKKRGTQSAKAEQGEGIRAVAAVAIALVIAGLIALTVL